MMKKKAKLLVFLINLGVGVGSATLLVTHEDAQVMLAASSIPYSEMQLKSFFDEQASRVQYSYYAFRSKPIVCRLKSVIEKCTELENYTEAQVEHLLNYVVQNTPSAESNCVFVKSMLVIWLERYRKIPKQLLFLFLNYLDCFFPPSDPLDRLTVDSLHGAKDLLNTSILQCCFSRAHIYDETIFQDASEEIKVFCSFLRDKEERRVLANILIPLFIQSCLQFCYQQRAKSMQEIIEVCIGDASIPAQASTPSLCCLCSNAPLNKRLELIIRVVETVLAKHPDRMAPLVLTSVASGGCYIETLILSVLLHVGYKNITLACLDIAYEACVNSDNEDIINEDIIEVKDNLKQLSGFAQLQIESYRGTDDEQDDMPYVEGHVVDNPSASNCDARVSVALFPMITRVRN